MVNICPLEVVGKPIRTYMFENVKTNMNIRKTKAHIHVWIVTAVNNVTMYVFTPLTPGKAIFK